MYNKNSEDINNKGINDYVNMTSRKNNNNIDNKTNNNSDVKRTVLTNEYNVKKNTYKSGNVTSHHEQYSYSFSDGTNNVSIKKNATKNNKFKVFVFLLIIFIINILFNFLNDKNKKDYIFNSRDFVILSTIENKDMEDMIVKYGKKNGIDVMFEYAEDLEAVSLINAGGEYDAIWASNSLWLYQVEKYSINNLKSISINPIVMAIKKSKAIELGFTDRDIKTAEILNAIKNGNLKYVMSSPVKTNSGASSYLGFLNSLAGSPEVLKTEMLNDKELKNSMVTLFSGVERVSGTDTFLEDMFLKSNEYEAVIAAETSLIRINQELEKNNKEPLYLIYPSDGVAISDSPFAYIDRNQNKEDKFDIIQKYLLSKETQKNLEEKGRRTWYGGINLNANKKVFNKNWGIDTSKYIIPQKYPSKKVIREAIALYIEEFRKPSHTVFLLDYSGSMYGDGNTELVNAMKYILNYQEASKDLIQFSEHDKITVIPFTAQVENTWQSYNGKMTDNLLYDIENKIPNGGTNIYVASIKGLEILSNESDDFTKTIILMTDGQSSGDYNSFYLDYTRNKMNIPIYSIMFGQASSSQLNNIANLTNAKVFDGRINLLEAFKEVRSFN